jgi:hypothetical protein
MFKTWKTNFPINEHSAYLESTENYYGLYKIKPSVTTNFLLFSELVFITTYFGLPGKLHVAHNIYNVY